MAGTTEGGKKAARTRGHESLSEAGRKGGQSKGQSQGNQGSRSEKGSLEDEEQG